MFGKDKPQETEQGDPVQDKPQETAKPEQAKGVKVTKGGISKFIDPSQVAAYKANGWS